MINSINFTSAYSVQNTDKKTFEKFQRFCNANRNNKSWGVHKEGHPASLITLVVPDSSDIDVEKYCAAKGITYKKQPKAQYQALISTKDRIAPAPEGMKLVTLDAQKLEDIALGQEENIFSKNAEYEKYKDEVDDYVKTSDSINTSAIYLIPLSGRDKFLNSIKKEGIESISDNELMINLCAQTSDKDDLVYSALRAQGLKKVPVYVTQATYEVGKAIGVMV